jgi:hypothetical protein
MAQITLYIDDQLQARLRDVAEQRKVSQSQFVADLIRTATSGRWSQEVLDMAGAAPDFPLADELRAGLLPDPPRDGL